MADGELQFPALVPAVQKLDDAEVSAAVNFL
jgi:hypothetical protein